MYLQSKPMLEFPQPPKAYSQVVLDDTDKPLPKRLDPNTRYAYFSTIAQGGKSLIKSCRDLHLSRVVCYKTLKPEFAKDEIEQRRLLREARVSAMLQHPNTVPTYELGRDNRGNYYFTMKLVHGYTLREILNYRDRYDLSQLVDVLIQIGHALDYAHNHGVVHRDIKPENILVGPYGEVVLLDWGLAKVWSAAGGKEGQGLDESAQSHDTDLLSAADDAMMEGLTQGGQVQGTVMYMSPEQLARSPDIGAATDLYSLAAVLYEVLTGHTPFAGEKVYEVVRQINEHEPLRPSARTNLPVPSLLEEVTMTCLRKDPGERFADMGQMLRLLQERW